MSSGCTRGRSATCSTSKDGSIDASGRLAMSQQTLDAPASWRRELVDDPAGFVAARPHLILIPVVFVVFAPLIIVWFGFGISSKVIIAAMVGFFPVLVNVIVGLKTVDQGKLDLMGSLDATRWQTFRLVKFPNALPFVFAGLDIAIVFSVLGAIVGEFVGAQRGLGTLILQFNYNLDTAGVFAVMILLAVLGVALHVLMQVIQRRVIFWAEPDEVVGA